MASGRIKSYFFSMKMGMTGSSIAQDVDLNRNGMIKQNSPSHRKSYRNKTVVLKLP
jgi:hypothetical protein